MGLTRPTSTAPDAAPARVHTAAVSSAAKRRAELRALLDEPQGAEKLVARLQKEADRGLREAGFTALLHHAGAASVRALMPLLRSDDASLRNSALEVLAHMPDAAAPVIDELLGDADPDVRILTVNLLQDLKHPKVVDWLVGVLDHEDTANGIAAAVEVLTELADPRALGALKSARGRWCDEPFLVFAIDMALQRYEAP